MFVWRCTALSLFLKDVYCLQSMEMVAAWGPACFFFLSLYPSCAKYTHKQTQRTHTCVQITNSTHCTDMYKQKPTHKKDSALSQTSASQLASALISPWKRIIFSLFILFFVYCEQTKALSAANHCVSNSDLPQSLKKGFSDNLLKFRLPF